MGPGALLCGLLVWVQSYMWEPIKEKIPGFIHGLTKSKLV